MRMRIFFLLAALMFSIALTGQSGLVSGNLNVSVFPTNIGGGKFLVSGIFSDPKGQSFTGDVDTGMVFWKGNNLYLIDSVVTASGSNLTIRVRDVYSTGFIPTGVGFVVERTPKGIPGVSVTGDSNPSFSTPPDYAANLNNILLKIDSLLDGIETASVGGDLDGNLPAPLVVGLNGIPLSPFSANPDSLTVLQFNGTEWVPVTFLSGIMVATDSFYVDNGNVIALVQPGDTLYIPALPPDKDGIYSGDGTVPSGTIATLEDIIRFRYSSDASSEIIFSTEEGVIYINASGAMGRLSMSDGSSGVEITPVTGTDNYTLVLPPNDGDAGQILSTDGSGVTSWIDAATGANIYNTNGTVPNSTARVMTIPLSSSLLFSNSPYSMGFTSSWGSASNVTGWGGGYSSGGVKAQHYFGLASGSPVSGSFVETGSVRNGLFNTISTSVIRVQNPGTLNGGAATAAIGGTTIGYLTAGAYTTGLSAGNGTLQAFNTNTSLTVNYPFDRPLANSFWRYNTDGTGQYVSATSIGATDLTFSGSGPVALNSSTGTDVTITAGSNVNFSGVSSSNITINASDNNGIYSGDGVVANGRLVTLSGQIEFVNGVNALVLSPNLGLFSIGSGIATNFNMDVSGNFVGLRGTSSTAASFRFLEGISNGNNYAQIKAPNLLASNYTITLPVDDGTTGQVLSTDGSGVTSWINAGDGGNGIISALPVGDVTILTNDNTLEFNTGHGAGEFHSTMVFRSNYNSDDAQVIAIKFANSASQDSVRVYWYDGSFYMEGEKEIQTIAELIQLTDENGAFVRQTNGYFYVKSKGTEGGQVRLLEGSGTDYVNLKSPDVLAAPYDLTFPTTDGNAGQILTNTDGLGTLAWSNGPGSTVEGTFSGTTSSLGVLNITLPGIPSAGVCVCSNNSNSSGFAYIFSITYTGGTGATIRVYDTENVEMLNTASVNVNVICR